MITESRKYQQELAGPWRDLSAETDLGAFSGSSEGLMPEEEIRLAFHALSMHQYHLEMEDEELRLRNSALHSACSRYFDLYDRAPVSACAIAASGEILEANRAAATLLGMAREQLINLQFSQFVHPDDRDRLSLAVPGGLTYSESSVSELRMVAADGRMFWAHLTSVGYQQVVDREEYHLVFADITDRRLTEEALRSGEFQAREKNHFFKSLLDALPIRLFWKDLSSTFLGCNRLFAEDAGFQVPEEMIGLSDNDMGWKDQAARYRRDDLAVMNSGKPRLRYEELQTAPDGKQIWLSTSKVPLRNAEGEIIGVLGCYEDITHRKWVEEQLLKAQKVESLESLAGGIAHQFNNMLMTIMGNVALAKALLPPDHPASERLTKAETGVIQAKELAGQLLPLARGGHPVKETLAVDDLVGNCSRLALAGTDAHLAFTTAEELWAVDADAAQITQVVNALLLNADQTMEEGGTIRILCANRVISEEDHLPLKNGRYVAVTLEDQGKGIPGKCLDKVFDPACTATEMHGGLGLAAAHAILHNHQGLLTVQSAEGAGTTCTFFLPAASAQVPVPADEDAVIRARSGRVLVMDDDEMVRIALAAMLETLGYTTVFANDGGQAVEKYAQAAKAGLPFDAVIMDLVVPGGMGGKEAMERLRAMDREAKVIVSSGYSSNSVLSDYQTYGFCGVLAKPYRFSELSNQLDQIMSR